MSKKKRKVAKRKPNSGRATNCNDQCSNYENCSADGTVDRFLMGGTCSDFFQKETGGDKGIDAALLERAKKKVGMSPEQIAIHTAVSLKAYCDGIHPTSNPDAKPQRGVVPKMEPSNESMPDVFELDSKMDASSYINRAQFDEANKQAELMRINRTYGAQSPTRIVKDTNMVPVQGKDEQGRTARMFVTKYTIYMR